jgi:diguanylate cyclase (GGDEF)-like protein
VELAPFIAAVVIVAAVLGVWAYIGRRQLTARLSELQGMLADRTTELESARVQVQRLSIEDSLTAVANHEVLLEFLDREWRRARRDGVPLTLILVDLDHFRAYNRHFGRAAGDEVLKQVGHALSQLVGRPGDLVARYHRDEFAVVLASTDAAGAQKIAGRFRQAVEGLDLPAAPDGPAPKVTVSIATATAVPHRESAWEELDLIKAARHALREAQAAGGNRVMRANLGLAGPPELVGP